jgi:hypothetical protein
MKHVHRHKPVSVLSLRDVQLVWIVQKKPHCHVALACSHLIVDAASLAALDIFKEEEHPSAMGIGSSKEGVSVYGLLQRCMTGMVRWCMVQAGMAKQANIGRHSVLMLMPAVTSTLSHGPCCLQPLGMMAYMSPPIWHHVTFSTCQSDTLWLRLKGHCVGLFPASGFSVTQGCCRI